MSELKLRPPEMRRADAARPECCGQFYCDVGLLLLAAFTVLAVATSKGAKRKVFSILIIIDFMAVGFAVGFLLGFREENNVIGV